jgi:hypothetical protein
MKTPDAITAFLALGQETRLNIFRLIVQRGDTGLTPSELVEMLDRFVSSESVVRIHIIAFKKMARTSDDEWDSMFAQVRDLAVVFTWSHYNDPSGRYAGE